MLYSQVTLLTASQMISQSSRSSLTKRPLMSELTEPAEHIQEEVCETNVATSYDDETIIWEGGPSQWINISTYFFWFIIFAAIGVFVVIWNSGLKDGYEPFVLTLVNWTTNGVYILGSINLLHSYLDVRFEYTIITQNKIKEAKGITKIFRQEKFCEISEIRDINSPPTGILGLLGLSSLLIETNDDDQPLIRIRAIRDREVLISKLLPVWRKLKIDRKGYFG